MTSRDEVIEALKQVRDPELLLDVWFLGLIYDIEIRDREVYVEMTLTSPACPYAPELIMQVEQAVFALPDVDNVDLNVVFDPPWEPSEEVMGFLGML